MLLTLAAISQRILAFDLRIVAQTMRNHEFILKTGISFSPAFEEKGLACYAANSGIKCGHDCLYCSTGAMVRMHPAFRILGENPFGHDYSIVDPSMPERVAKDAARIKNRGLIQLGTISDAWSPEAQNHNIGRRSLQAILTHPGWSVRILSKNAAVVNDFDLIEQYRDRVRVGLSITATPDNDEIINIIEPHASSIQDRMLVMVEAAARRLRTYAMFCPLLPGIADAPDQIDRLVKFGVDCRAEEIFVEPVNPRGPSLKNCQEALEKWGYDKEAAALGAIRKRDHWSRYVVNLLGNVQSSVRRHFDIGRLRFLLYPSRLRPADIKSIKDDDAGVRWLGENE
jgi:DNA repair photolyase